MGVSFGTSKNLWAVLGHLFGLYRSSGEIVIGDLMPSQVRREVEVSIHSSYLDFRCGGGCGFAPIDLRGAFTQGGVGPRIITIAAESFKLGEASFLGLERGYLGDIHDKITLAREKLLRSELGARASRRD
ncbi:hypothetical protein FNV43_RR11070 [Rhamnella rubrinervis]|uniref:Uncharacterized protein n=1 Tax=Rhamnella rubrinervis TaxID=2594499 RepID=A0A8K0H5A7_9ROSA|nr:hypothetical protein FNV43_RR11070 [Rhamnella rubrinervis]